MFGFFSSEIELMLGKPANFCQPVGNSCVSSVCRWYVYFEIDYRYRRNILHFIEHLLFVCTLDFHYVSIRTSWIENENMAGLVASGRRPEAGPNVNIKNDYNDSHYDTIRKILVSKDTGIFRLF